MPDGVSATLGMALVDDVAGTPRHARQTVVAQLLARGQAWQRRGQALPLVVRAKVRVVESSIATLESELVGKRVLRDGGTVGEWMAPQIGEAYGTGGWQRCRR